MNPSPSTLANDEALADLLDALTARLQQGERLNEAAILAAHPEFAAALQELFPALRMLGDLSQSHPDTLNGLMDSKAHPLVGTLGDFRLLREVGRGGMGVVYEAEQITLGRRVALKVLPFAATMDPRQLQRFQNEVRAAASLHHEHIVPVHTVGCERGLHYFAMQYIDGKTLAEMVRELSEAKASREQTTADLTEKQRGDTKTAHSRGSQRTAHDPDYFRNIADLGAQAALALEHAHSQGIVHRDIKPANLMIDAQGKLWVTDFGLAQVGGSHDLTASGDVIGTLRYMSPEQALAKHNLVDHRTDIYSLGATLYEMLTLTPAISGQDRHELLQKIAFADPPAPRVLVPDLPRELETIILKAIAKDPHLRYQSAEDLAEDLRRYLNDQPIKAKRTTTLQLLARWRRRNPALATALSLLLAVIVVGNLLVAWMWKQERAARNDAQTAENQAKERAAALQRSAYFQSIARADLEWWANNVARADQELERCPEELRHWEWGFLKGLCHSELRHFQGHTGRVRAVAYSPEGKYLASGGSDSTVRLWDVTTNKEVRVLKGHTSQIWTLTFSPDGRYVASASGDWNVIDPGEVIIWDVTTGHAVANYPMTGNMIDTLAYSPDGQTLAAACWDGTVRLLNPATGHERRIRGHNTACKALVYSPDGKYLATGGNDARICLWDVAKNYTVTKSFHAHDADVLALAYSPDGNTLLSSSWDHTVRLWNTRTWQAITLTGHGGPVDGVAVAPDGKQCASSATDGTVRLWAMDTGKELTTIRVHDRELHGLAYSPGGRALATVGWGGTVKVWDLPHRQLGRVFNTSRSAHKRVFFPPEGQTLLILHAGEPMKNRPGYLEVRDLRTTQPKATLARRAEGLTDAALSSDGRFVAVASGSTVTLVDTTTGKEVRTLPVFNGAIHTLLFDPQSTNLFVATLDGVVTIWETTTGELIQELHGPEMRPTALACSDDGRYLAASTTDGRIVLWNLTQRRSGSHPERVFATFGQPVATLAFRPHTHHVAAGYEDGVVRCFDASNGVGRLELVGHVGSVLTVSYSPDGQRLATGGTDGTVVLWDAVHGHEALTLRRQQGGIGALAFSPDGLALASLGYESSVGRVWLAGHRDEDHDARERAWHEAEATGAEAVRRWDAVALHRAWLLANEPSDARQSARLGAARAELGQMTEARADYLRALQTPGASKRAYDYVLHRTDYAYLLLQHGDTNGYMEQCHRLVEDYRTDRDLRIIEAITRCFRLHQGDRVDLQPALPLAERLALVSKTDAHRIALRGMIYYRAGRYAEALHSLMKAAQLRGENRDGDVFDWLWLALAYAQAKHPALACLKLSEATLWLDRHLASKQTPPGFAAPLTWVQKMELTRLRQEAEALLAVPERQLNRKDLLTQARREEIQYLSKVLATDGMNVSDLMARANGYAELEDWALAAADYGQLTTMPGAPPVTWYRWTTALRAANDIVGFKKACQQYLRLYGESPNPGIVSLMLYSLTLLPEPPCDVDRWLELGERAKGAFVGNQRLLGAVRYRAGAYAGALKAFEEAQQVYPRRAWDWYFVALCQHKLGQSAEALRSLRRADDWVNDAERLRTATATAVGPRWFHWEERQEVLLLKRETEALLAPKK